MKLFLTFLLSLALGASVEFDKMVHDFGTVSESDGELNCSFEVLNSSQTDSLSLFAVFTSCGCTNVKWTRTAIAPGQKGQISVSYSNDEGPYPFDKSVTVYTSAQKKPFVLHIKGVVEKKKK